MPKSLGTSVNSNPQFIPFFEVLIIKRGAYFAHLEISENIRLRTLKFGRTAESRLEIVFENKN